MPSLASKGVYASDAPHSLRDTGPPAFPFVISIAHTTRGNRLTPAQGQGGALRFHGEALRD